ncbi:MAG: flotillin [Rhodobacteraceae bacterium]|nr:flotillin [Paracoccaceae bacterium]PCJ86809.1 MAG: flotillin [Hyphomicrobiales bacterium]
MNALGWVILLLVIIAAIIALAAWFYERATNEVSLVKTGIGGRQVIIDGGTLALPYFHEISPVNMQTIRMDVTRRGESALITKDRMRVDVGAEFYTSVMPEEEAIARAAQTLGRRTFHPDQLKTLIDGMMVDALRAVAARMTMDELHEDRTAFVREVREALKGTLEHYGLQLDSVSLTDLDQTPFSALDENNAFNAVGMRRLAEVIAKSKKERAEIEGESDVAVRRIAMEANRRKLEIDLEERRAEIAQTQEIETLLAAQLIEVARHKAEAEREAAQARIHMEREIQSADISRERAIREAEIAQQSAVEIAEAEHKILLSGKSQEESRARAEADIVRAQAVEAEEAVNTARQVLEAERRKQIALLAAQQEAEANATRARIAAQSDRATAKDRKETMREEAEARKLGKLAEVEAETARIASENTRSEAQAAMEMEKIRLKAMPEIIAQMVKPAEKIDSITVHHVAGARGENGEASTPVAKIMDTILDMSVAMPTLNSLGAFMQDSVTKKDAKK